MDQQINSEPIKNKASWKKRGAAFGLLLSIVALFIFHMGDPYYNNTATAKAVFWIGIVPVVIIVFVFIFFILGVIIDWLRNKRR